MFKYLIYILPFIFCSALETNGQILNKGLVGHYLFNGDLIDNSGNGNNGKRNGGVQFGIDRFGSACGALHFNGRDGYVTIPDSKSLKSPRSQLTVATWFRLDTMAGPLKWLTVVCKSNLEDELDDSPQYRFQVTNKTISINTEFTEEFDLDLEFDTWYHYALVIDGSAVRSYLNGAKVFEFPYSNNLVSNNMPLEIGRDLPGAQEYMAGSLDDLRIYNRSLSAREIKLIYIDKSEFSSAKPCDPVISGSGKNPPIVSIITPGTSPYITKHENELIKASIQNITDKKNIKFKVNGKLSSGFIYNINNEVFTAKVSLKQGFNQIEISATNMDGSDLATTILNYREMTKPIVPPPPQPPQITIVKPTISPYPSTNNNHNVRATLEHVKNAKNITYRVNGQNSRQFKYDESNGIFVGIFNLVEGNNFYEIIATNADGSDTKSGIITYEPLKLPPTINVVKPSSIPAFTGDSTYLLKATINNIIDKRFITLLLNGQKVGNFSFDPYSKLLETNFILNPGYNYFEINAKNDDGKDKAIGSIHFEQIAPSPVQGEISIKHDFELTIGDIELVCFDHKKPDGDTVSIILNDFVIVDRMRLEPKGKGEFRQKFSLTPNKEYILISKAWNLGKEPPNTMTMEIYSGTKRLKTIKLESEIGKSEAIRFVYKPS